MYQFSTVKKACDFLVNKTGKHWEAKYYMYDGERFYFVWHAIELPFNQRQNSLVCRGNKKQVLAKLEKIANSPVLPNFV